MLAKKGNFEYLTQLLASNTFKIARSKIRKKDETISEVKLFKIAIPVLGVYNLQFSQVKFALFVLGRSFPSLCPTVGGRLAKFPILIKKLPPIAKLQPASCCPDLEFEGFVINNLMLFVSAKVPSDSNLFQPIFPSNCPSHHILYLLYLSHNAFCVVIRIRGFLEASNFIYILNINYPT